MKVVLSRKGFDSEFGGYPSPILPDGKMLSLPIPAKGSQDLIKYANLHFENKTLYELMKQLKPKIKINREWVELTEDTKCHLDPDIYKNLMTRSKRWKPIFGQVGAAQVHLDNQEVGEGDLFLFFGWFRKTKYLNGKIIFDPKESAQHVIFGYLQVGEKIKVGINTKLPSWMSYHPHTKPGRRRTKNNTIYIAKDSLSWNNKLPGAGTFNYHKSLVLTKQGFPKSIWNLPPFFKDIKISYHSEKNWKAGFFKSVSRGQEFVIQDNEKVENWTKNLIQNNITTF